MKWTKRRYLKKSSSFEFFTYSCPFSELLWINTVVVQGCQETFARDEWGTSWPANKGGSLPYLGVQIRSAPVPDPLRSGFGPVPNPFRTVSERLAMGWNDTGESPHQFCPPWERFCGKPKKCSFITFPSRVTNVQFFLSRLTRENKHLQFKTKQTFKTYEARLQS